MTDSGSWSGCSWEAMCTPFPVKRDDSLAYDNKMAFWMAAIQELCVSRKTTVFNLTQLPLNFQKHGRAPKCLDTVVQQMVSQGLVRRLSDFVDELDPEGSRWSAWNLIPKPIASSLNWAYQKMFSSTKGNEGSSSGSGAKDELYVMVELVKTFAEGIEELHRKHVSSMPSAENLISYGALMQMSRNIVDDETSFRLALLHLSEQKRCFIATDDDGQKVVRMVERGEELAEPSTIELKRFRMKNMTDKLEASITSDEHLMDRYKQSAKESLNKGNRNEAMRFLRRKKQLEASVNTKEMTLDRILTLITVLEQTESHKQALDAYRSGIEAFKTMKEDCGMSVEEIDKTMLNLQEMFDDNHEFEKSMAFNTSANSGSEDDLEKELNELLDVPILSPRQMNVGAEEQTGKLSSPVASEVPIIFPDVPANDPQGLNSVDTKEPANTAVTSRSEPTSTRSQPARVAKKGAVTKS